MNTSSQSFAPMSRLLWKEYRAQRALWLAMLGLGLAPQILLRMLISHPTDAVIAVWSMVMTVPLLFTIGSTAILFAGEREEKTSDWLLHLAAPPVWILMAKWSLVLIAALALALSLSISAVLLVWALPPGASHPQAAGAVAGILWYFAGFLVWGTLGSLLSRRVITAVPAMGFWCMMTMLVPVVWLPWLFGYSPSHPNLRRAQEVLVVLSFVVVGAADVWLGWRWCRGRYLDAQILDDWNTRLTALLNRLRGKTAVCSRLPARAESANAWLREWQRLVWQERRRETYHRMLLCVGCIVGLFMASLDAPLVPGLLPLILLFPLAMGILGFRYDGEGQPLRFLANRGVSPRIVWLAKHAVWLPRALWIPLVVWCFVGAADQLLFSHRAVRSGVMSLSAANWFAWSNWNAVLWFVLLGYGCGHLAAMALRRVILAVVVGVWLNVVVAHWMLLMLTLQVPAWWSVGGQVMWLFAISWWLAPRWMLEREFRWPRRLVLRMIVPPLTLMSVVGVWRAFEVPGFGPQSQAVFSFLYPHEPGSDGVEQFTVRRNAVMELQGEISRRSLPATEIEQQDLDRLASVASGLDLVQDFLPPNPLRRDAVDAEQAVRDQGARQSFWAANEPRLAVIMSVVSRERVPADNSLDSSLRIPDPRLLLEAGRLRTDEGRLTEALNYYCAALRLTSYRETRAGFTGRSMAPVLQQMAFGRVIAWANHPDQTTASLRSAVVRIRRELELVPTIREMIVAEYLEELAWLDRIMQHPWDAEHYQAMSQSDVGWRPVIAGVSRFLPFERQRAHHLMQQVLLDQELATRQLQFWLSRPGTDATRLFEDRRNEGAARRGQYLQSTPLVHPNWTQIDASSVATLIRRETIARETLLALSLLAHRSEHGRWPDALDELLKQGLAGGELPAVTVIDPWCGESFRYRGPELNREPGEGPRSVLLASVGSERARQVTEDNRPPGTLTAKNWRGENLVTTNVETLRLEVVNGELIPAWNLERLAP
jgi:hypothetical protein